MYNFKHLRNFFKQFEQNIEKYRKTLRKFKKTPSKCFRNFKQFNKLIAQICGVNYFENKIKILNKF